MARLEEFFKEECDAESLAEELEFVARDWTGVLLETGSRYGVQYANAQYLLFKLADVLRGR